MKSSRKQAFYDDLVFQVFEEVYEPAEDTFLAADILTHVVKEGDTLLDIGTGCGILAIIAARKAKKIVATDVNPYAVKCARLNAKTNGVASRIQMLRGDLFQPIRGTEKFDVIVFNAPYLPTSQREEERTWIAKSWAGGPTGRRVVDRFIEEARRRLKRNGKILLVQSSLTNFEETINKFRKYGLDAKVIAEKKVAFETIFVIQASHLSKLHVKSYLGGRLKFLVLQWVKAQVPIERLASLTPAQFKYLDTLESQGKIEKYYHLIGQQGHMTICNVDSDEELSKIISEDPLFFDSERKIYPLTTRETHEKRLLELLRRR